MENKKWQRRREKNIKLSFFGSFLKKLYGLINVYVILYIVCLEFIALLRLWCTCDVASALVLLSRIQYILYVLSFLSTWRVLYVVKIVVPVQLLLLSPWSIPMITWRRDVPRARGKSRGLQDSATPAQRNLLGVEIREVTRALLTITCPHVLNSV